MHLQIVSAVEQDDNKGRSMRAFRSIEIDYDVHRVIEFARSHITESPNEVLRRLLGIDADSVDSEDTAAASGNEPQQELTNARVTDHAA